MSDRKLMLQIDSELRAKNLDSLKFLCAPCIKRNKAAQIDTGHKLFLLLEDQQLINNNNLSFLCKMLQAIGRKDLCDKIGKGNGIQVDCDKPLALALEFKFHELLFEISEDMAQRDVDSLRYLYDSVPRNREINVGYDLFSVLIDLEELDPSNVDSLTPLIENLEDIHRKDLAKQLKDFRDSFASAGGPKNRLTTELKLKVAEENSEMSPGMVSGGSPNQSALEESPNQTAAKSYISVHSNNFGGLGNLLTGMTLSTQAESPRGREEKANKSENLTVHTHPSGLHSFTTLPGTTALPRYKMDAKPRGFCLVINNEEFTYNPRDTNAKKLKPRKGSKKDTENIKKCFEALHFDVKVESDLNDVEMKSTFKKYAEDEKNKDHDCFVAFVLSHGGTDRGLPFLYGRNGVKVYLDDIISVFKPDCCPSLFGKPKLFFLACCLGGSYSNAVARPEAHDGVSIDGSASLGTEDVDSLDSYKSNDEDFLIGYSTVRGHVSFRDTQQGTWYISAITQVFTEYHKTENIQNMLVEVNNRVARNIFSGRNNEGMEGNYAQVPSPQHTLTKQLWL